MKDVDIVPRKIQRVKLRYETRLKGTRSTWGAYRKIKSEIKQKIRATETLFCKNILNSKNAKDVWKVIHHILNQKSTILEGHVGDINKFFNYSAPRVLRKKPVKTPDT